MSKKLLSFFLLTLLLSTILSGCGEKENTQVKDNNNNSLIVYTTVYPLADFTKKIGGDYVQVKSIYPPGIDEHSYEPKQKEIIQMANADLFFAIGYNLEGFIKKAEPILKSEGVKVVSVGEQIDLKSNHADKEEATHEEDEDGHNHGSIDPHIWIDPLYSIQLANIIKQNLISEMPEQKETFEKNFKELEAKLQDLHEQFLNVVKNAKFKKFIVSHAAYGYWEERYGIEQLHISGISTSQEPSQKQLMEIVDEIKKNHLQYILVEQNVNNKLVKVIQEETKSSTLPIHNLSVLTEKDIKNGEDYFSLMEKNIKTLEKALN